MKDNVGLPDAAKSMLAMVEVCDKSRIILVENYKNEYVVSTQYRHGRDWDSDWSQGHYFTDLLEARRFFWSYAQKRI